MIFTEMQQTVSPLIQQIYALPFNRELSQGTLASDIFVFYLSQDMLYLADYAKALALIAARLSNNNQAQQFMQFALNAILAERKLHRDYVNKYFDDKHACDAMNEQSPFCFIYTNYLLKMASIAPLEEALASVLPCFFVYHEVGQKVATLNECQGENPYQQWINLYSGDEFKISMNLAIDIINEVGSLAPLHVKKNMIVAFLKSTQLEWNFWKGAYNKEKWENFSPVHAP